MDECRSFGEIHHPGSQSRNISIGITSDSLTKRSGGNNEENEGTPPGTGRLTSKAGNPIESKNKGEACASAKWKQTDGSREDPVNGFRSFWHPCSQSRKISVGIAADLSSKKDHGAHAGNEGALSKTEKQNSIPRNLSEAKNKQEDIASSNGEQTEATGCINSPWVRNKKQLDVEHDSVTTHSVKYFTKQASDLQNGEVRHKKFNGKTYTRKGQHGNSDGLQFNFANTQEVLDFHDAVVEDKQDKTENRKSDTLKMKLWEILGTVSPESQPSISQGAEVGGNDLNQKKPAQHLMDTVLKPRQNSDTIEADSEGHSPFTNVPVTRYLTPKQAQAVQQKEVMTYKYRNQGSIVSSKKQNAEKLEGAIVNGSELTKRKENQKEPLTVFLENNSADKVQQSADMSETPAAPKRIPSFGQKIASVYHLIDNDSGGDADSNHGRDHLKKATRKDQLVELENPTSPKNGGRQQYFSNTSVKNILEPQYGFCSPTFVFKAPVGSPSAGSTPKTVHIEEDDSKKGNEKDQQVELKNQISPENGDRKEKFSNTPSEDAPKPQNCSWSPTFVMGTTIASLSASSTPKTVDIVEGVHSRAMLEQRFTVENNWGSQSCKYTLPVSPESCADLEFPGGAFECRDSSPVNPRFVKENRYMEGRLSSERCFENTEECSPVIIGRKCRGIVSSGSTIQEPEFTFVPNKRPRSCEENGECSWFQESRDHNQDDDLTRAVKLFALALGKLRRKINSATKQKSAEVLMVIFYEIISQLQNAEFQIETDIEKMSRLSKSRRKSLETRCQEQIEQLKLIQERFENEIHHHL